MSSSTRVCPECGHFNPVSRFRCESCTRSLSGTIPVAKELAAARTQSDDHGHHSDASFRGLPDVPVEDRGMANVGSDELLTYAGRTPRLRYLMATLCIAVPAVLVNTAISASQNPGMSQLLALVIVAWLQSFPAVRRLHDMNLQGGYILPVLVLSMIPVLGALVAFSFVLVLLFTPGTPGPNRYGPDPLGAAVAPVNT